MTSQVRSSRLSRNAAFNLIAYAFVVVVNFFISPLVVQYLGTTRFGVWSLLVGLVGYLGLLDFGIRQAVNRYIAHHQAVGAHEECSSIVSAAMRLYGFLGLLAIVISGALAYFSPILFNIPDLLVHDTRVVVVLGGLTVAVSLTAGVFGGVVSGLQRFDIQCGLEIVLTTFRAVSTVVALREGYGLVALACINLAISVLTWFIYRAAAHKLYRQLRFALRGSLLRQAQVILSFGAFSVAIHFLYFLSYNSSALIIAAFLPIEAVAFFAIAGNLLSNAAGLTAALSSLMTPRVSALASTGSNKVGAEILAVAKITTLLMAPIAATFILRGESFIALWMGFEYGPASGEILQILAIVLWLGASRAVVVHSFTGLAKHHTLIAGFAAEAVCSIALGAVLVRHLGIMGVALGIAIPSVLVSLGYIPRCLLNVAEVPVRLFYRNAILLPTAACFPFALASAVIERFVPATNLAIFFVQVVMILPLVPITAWFWCLTAVEKEQVRSAIREVVGR